ncbi:MAG: protein disulfide oxidoreductase [Idiomarinaceae bacterium]|nr:protein disulfide oxidoreductase [Idiomarinaceae bacterium]
MFVAFKNSVWAKRIAKTVGYFVAIFIIAMLVDWYRSTDIETTVPEQSATLRTLQGDTVDIIERSKEAPVLVYFWATWCPYCTVVSPMVDGIAEDYDVVTVAFSSGADEKVMQFAQQKGYEFATVNDQTGVLARRWGVSVTPTILIIRDGEVQSVTTGLTTSLGMRARLMLAR